MILFNDKPNALTIDTMVEKLEEESLGKVYPKYDGEIGRRIFW